MKIRLFVTDVDGTMTDGGMYYASDGTELKRFNTRDGMGLRLLAEYGIQTAIITGEDSPIVLNRAKKLRIERVYMGIEDKAEILRQIWKETGIAPEETSYIGDDINDLSAIRIAGWTACPADALDAVKREVNVILTKNGGYGAVREWCDKIADRTLERPLSAENENGSPVR